MALAGTEKSYSWTFFLVSQVLVFLALYSLYDEGVVRRPWKRYQDEFNAMQRQVAVAELEALKKKFAADGGESKLKELELQLETSEIALESADYRSLKKQLAADQILFDDAELAIKFDKSVLDNKFYEYKHALQHNHEFKAKKSAYDELNQSILDKSAALMEQKKGLDALKAKIAAYDDKVADLKKQIETLQKPIVDAQIKVDNIDFRPVEIRQVVVEDFGKGGNINWGRVDRCMTCHTGIDKPGLEDVAQALRLTVVKDDVALAELLKQKPELKNFAVTEKRKGYLQKMYGTHPRSQDMMVKHPVEQFGCTTCHGGDGRSVNIMGKAFGEEDKAHAFHEHGVERLLRGPQMQSNCLACHKGQIELDYAKDLTHGLELFVELGCQNCHAVDQYDKLFRVAPELNKVGNKVRTAWLVDWLKNPFDYMPNSRMPNFRFSDDDAVALASYLVANSVPHRISHQKNLPGNAVNGRRLFDTVGCAGCHSSTGDAASYAVRSRAPNLSRLSAKVQSAAWVYDWIKDPKNYSAHARMPSLRLTDQEASDITAYLMGQNSGYAGEIAKRSGELAKRVDAHDQELIDRGRKIIGERGCYSCHLLKGFEKGERIGPSLTAEALKETFEFDYGDALQKGRTFTDAFGRKVHVTHLKESPGELTSDIVARAAKSYKGKPEEGAVFANLEETWQSWIRNKLRFPMEMYEHERAQLKMPNFNLTPEELDSLVVFIKGLTNRNVPYQFDASQRERHQKIIAGQRLVAEKNCLGCHAIGDYGADITAKIDAYDHGEFGPVTQHYPPELTHVGEKIRPEWLSEYLKDPVVPYRPAVTVRMPTFGFNDDEVNTLVDYFAALSGVTPQFTGTDYELDSELIAAGARLASNDQGLACFVCHLLNGKKPGDDPSLWAPDWERVRTKLQYGFIPRWIQDPAHFQKFAVMPAFLNAPEMALPGILDGKADKQLEALRAYILSVGDKRPYKDSKSDGARPYDQMAPSPTPSAAGVETNGGVL
jgi:mono/diheme cytochrome c family protein